MPRAGPERVLSAGFFFLLIPEFPGAHMIDTASSD
jgi:hypothetical protein